MLLSFAIIFLFGLFFSFLARRLSLPPLLALMVLGLLLGPSLLNWLSPDLLAISSQLRRIALIIILFRAGLALDVSDLFKVGRPAILMCFVPACFEIVGMMLLAPLLFQISLLEAALLGTVIAAVSPAVIVPRMLHLLATGHGKKAGVPQLIMAGAAVDDVFVLVLFTAALSLLGGGQLGLSHFISIPTAIILGIAVGWVAGLALARFFRLVALTSTVKLLILLSIGFILSAAEAWFTSFIGFSGLLAIMTMGVAILKEDQESAKALSLSMADLWLVAEILLFVLVGASIDVTYASQAAPLAVLLIILVLVFRMLGVYLSLLGTRFTPKERFFTMIAYTPKATVQAAIGGIPLSMGLASGQLILTVAVISIFLTAHLGAFLIDKTYPSWLKQD